MTYKEAADHIRNHNNIHRFSERGAVLITQALDIAAKVLETIPEADVQPVTQKLDMLEAENKALKELLRKAVHDFRRVTKGCLGVQCDSCPHIATFNGCIWQYAEEALKLIGGER